jgi:hypothetical protein
MRTALFLAGVLALCLFCALHVSASPPAPDLAAQCSGSYPARLADARNAIAEHTRYMLERREVMPWFEQHCRFLSELERAIRKLDDPAAFVCESAKGRPKRLTTAFIAEHSQPVDVVILQEFFHADDVCEPHDLAAGRPSLVLREPTTERKLAVLCWGKEGDPCAQARAKFAARARSSPPPVTP